MALATAGSSTATAGIPRLRHVAALSQTRPRLHRCLPIDVGQRHTPQRRIAFRPVRLPGPERAARLPKPAEPIRIHNLADCQGYGTVVESNESAATWRTATDFSKLTVRPASSAVRPRRDTKPLAASAAAPSVARTSPIWIPLSRPVKGCTPPGAAARSAANLSAVAPSASVAAALAGASPGHRGKGSGGYPVLAA